MDYEVRKARLEDLELLIQFTLGEAADAEGLEKAGESVRQGVLTGLKDPQVSSYWVLTEGEDVIGSISVVREWSDWNAGYYWWVQSMYILPEYRGRGLMGMLMDEVAEEAREQGALELRLYVYKDNASAIRAYRKTGFSDLPYQIMSREL